MSEIDERPQERRPSIYGPDRGNAPRVALNRCPSEPSHIQLVQLVDIPRPFSIQCVQSIGPTGPKFSHLVGGGRAVQKSKFNRASNSGSLVFPLMAKSVNWSKPRPTGGPIDQLVA